MGLCFLLQELMTDVHFADILPENLEYIFLKSMATIKIPEKDRGKIVLCHSKIGAEVLKRLGKS